MLRPPYHAVMGWRTQEAYDRAEERHEREWLASLSPGQRLRVSGSAGNSIPRELWLFGQIGIAAMVNDLALDSMPICSLYVLYGNRNPWGRLGRRVAGARALRLGQTRCHEVGPRVRLVGAARHDDASRDEGPRIPARRSREPPAVPALRQQADGRRLRPARRRRQGQVGGGLGRTIPPFRRTIPPKPQQTRE